jgi:hypothetical protein
MDASSLWTIVERIATLSAPGPKELGELLGVDLISTGGNEHWSFHRAASVELRVELSGKRRLLVLEFPDPELRLDQLGLLRVSDVRIGVNPSIMPEGTVDYSIDLEKAEVSFSFRARSYLLRSVAIRWD